MNAASACSRCTDKLSYILGNGVYYCALAAPLFLNVQAYRYYAVTATTSLALTVTRGVLARARPRVKAYQRPVVHGDDGTLRQMMYVGGFPSGHAFQAAFFCTMLFLAHSNCVGFAVAALGVVMVALFRYCKKFHTPLQIAAGTAVGVAMATATAPWVCNQSPR